MVYSQASEPKSKVAALFMVQLKKSVLELLAYLLVSKISVTANLPTVSTRRSFVCEPAN
jgi:hypothetical protein